MKVENIAKTYNTLTKYIRDTIFCNNGENRIMYKVKNKFYFISEKDNTCKCVCEVDSSFLECIDTDLKENVIFSYCSHSDYDIEKQLEKLQENKEKHVFAIFDSILAEIDRQDLLESSFFNFCINQIERENNIVYDKSIADSSIDTNMQETDTEPTEADFNTENTESSIKDNETQLDKAEFNTNIENKYINDMQSITKEANITDKDTIEKLMCLKDDISKHVKLIESLHDEREAKIEFEKIFKLHFIDITMTYPQAYNGIANNQVLKEKLKEVIFEAIKQENTESIARKDFSNKSLQNTESKQELDLKAKRKPLLAFSMKDISLSHKQHKSFTDYKHINSFNSVIEKRVIKAVIAKERSPPLHRGA
ncbi:hypothetical protein C826_02187 [Helicobacter bilis WiWa]|uniref:Uncharacterized protein n=1 Tax=Helicobacter bilis WiWa TaxID=1235804 RepID=N2BFJ2_9HELI|nr:hypothetical protein [Helicobacter bilis]EMZ37190.1 hypothetical protein C826_02187 [Helicobacter bilis WiWa]